MSFIFKIMTEGMENGAYDKISVWCLSIIIYSYMTKNAWTNKRCPLRES